MKPFQGLRKFVLCEFCVPAEWDCCVKASKIRAKVLRWNTVWTAQIWYGKNVLLHGEGYKKALKVDIEKIQFWRMEKSALI